jgi:hypothetical protein
METESAPIALHHRRKYQGQSGQRYELDLAYEKALGGAIQILVAFECKAYSRRVKLNELLELPACRSWRSQATRSSCPFKLRIYSRTSGGIEHQAEFVTQTNRRGVPMCALNVDGQVSCNVMDLKRWLSFSAT